MKVSSPLKYTDVSQAAYDQFKLIAKGHGLNITGNKDTQTYDLVGVATEYDPDKETLTFTTHPPFWMPASTISGHLHELVAEAMQAVEDQKNQKIADDVDAHRSGEKQVHAVHAVLTSTHAPAKR